MSNQDTNLWKFFITVFFLFACCYYHTEEMIVQKLYEVHRVADYPVKLAKHVEKCFLILLTYTHSSVGQNLLF